MALQGSRFGAGAVKTSLGNDLQANEVGGLREEGFVRDPHKRKQPSVFSLGYQLCLICLQLGEKGHSMSVTCKSSVENIYHVERAVAQKEFCV